jgi:hypothetical protein
LRAYACFCAHFAFALLPRRFTPHLAHAMRYARTKQALKEEKQSKSNNINQPTVQSSKSQTVAASGESRPSREHNAQK